MEFVIEKQKPMMRKRYWILPENAVQKPIISALDQKAFRSLLRKKQPS